MSDPNEMALIGTKRSWADASQELAASGDDKLAWPDFANEVDAKMKC